MYRSFLAIELTDPIIKKIEEVQKDLKSTLAEIRWMSPEKIHLTLKFFGNIEESKIDSISKSITELIQNTTPFSLEVRGVGAFPNLRNPRVIWIGVVDREKILFTLQEAIEIQLEKIGFQREDRPFHPHLTLGRMKSSRGKEELTRRLEKYKEMEFGSFQAERMILFKSDLKPSGPIYTPLRELMLGG